ncbi:tripartite motif-containing protein 16-like [Astyanax mexicanus]|uniref:tripartite motif-containing protein 16-like n=1 Tax=Astyanax mexicanus TaxID=7994 RepID=UPI0020CAF9C1|nr:tripartite motif-containing protein 16-like [Astyanax mexicanus]
MAEANVSLAQDEFSCSVCLDLLKDPVAIPCGHSFCMVCINGFWDEEDQKKIYSCPNCRHTFTSRPVVSKNTMLAEVVEKLKKTRLQVAPPDHSSADPEDVECDSCTGRKHKAVQSCLVCLASFCEAHLQPHYQSPAFKKHKLVKASRRLQEQICSQHDKLLEVYCRTDQQCICMLCTMDDHRGHYTVSLKAEKSEKQKQVVETQRKYKERIQKKEMEVQKLAEAVDSYKRSAQTAVEDSEKIFTEMILSIERRRSEVRQMIRDQEKAAVSRAEERLKRLEQEITELKRRDADLEKLSFTEDHIHFLQSFQSLSAAPGSSCLSDITLSPLNTFEVVKKSVSRLRGKLEKSWKEEFRKTSNAVKKLHIFSLPQPQSIEDFLEYSCQLTLDPNTANKLLLLSERNTVVTCSNTVQPYPDHPDRFNGLAQVLCRESVSGRCYWEVEWRGDGGVNIAVSYKSISRKGSGEECLFGCNNQSWKLDCNSSRYIFSYNNRETVISRAPISSRVGVYVDHRAGTLSFYSISDTMTLIHRVQTTFTQPLYAGFGFSLQSSVHLLTKNRTKFTPL